jgi:hypothetical protein
MVFSETGRRMAYMTAAISFIEMSSTTAIAAFRMPRGIQKQRVMSDEALFSYTILLPLCR